MNPDDVQNRLIQAQDEQLSRVVALVDRMEVRGAADALLEPVRSRLATLAPVRPLTVGRLLFQPLDPVVEPVTRWTPDAAAVPRTALGPLGAAILAAVAGCAAEVRTMISGQSWADTGVAAAAGTILWPAAAEAVAALAIPADWAASGLPAAYFEPIRNNVAAVLHHAAVLRLWPSEVERPGLLALVRAMLAETQARHPTGVAIVMAVLLANGAVAASVLEAALELPGSAADHAVEHALRRLENGFTASMPGAVLSAACGQALQTALLLEAVDGPSAPQRFRVLAQQTRHVADEACRDRVLQALDQHILPALASTTPLSRAATVGLEAMIRDIRRLSLVGQRLGAGSAYDRILGRTAAGIMAAPAPSLSRVDRLRLAGLLVGADAVRRLASEQA